MVPADAATAERSAQPHTAVVGPLVSIRGVSKRFTTRRADTLALEEINLELHEGEFVCVVGPSGCGKSTLLNIVAGFDRADAGEVVVEGRVVRTPGPDRIVVFQDSSLFPWLNVEANVEFGLKLARIPGTERKERVRFFLRLVGLEKYRKSFIHELSGGMRQRVQLARSLAVDPRILLMDEPFAALDAQTRDVLQEELQTIWQATRKTVLFVTHNVREAVLLADRVVVMSSSPGRIKRMVDITLEHPRNPDSHAVVDLSADIREELRNPEHVGIQPGRRWTI